MVLGRHAPCPVSLRIRFGPASSVWGIMAYSSEICNKRCNLLVYARIKHSLSRIEYCGLVYPKFRVRNSRLRGTFEIMVGVGPVDLHNSHYDKRKAARYPVARLRHSILPSRLPRLMGKLLGDSAAVLFAGGRGNTTARKMGVQHLGRCRSNIYSVSFRKLVRRLMGREATDGLL